MAATIRARQVTRTAPSEAVWSATQIKHIQGRRLLEAMAAIEKADASPELRAPIGEIVAVATCYDDLVEACRTRRRELGLPQLEVDELAGLQTGYTGKLECGDKRMGAMSLTCLLGALGLELVVVKSVPHHEKIAAGRAA